jgi:hypothetical protein
MAKSKKGISERAIDRLEERGALKKIRAEMKADVMQCLVDMEEAGEIPSDLRIKRFSPTEEEDKKAIKLIHQYLVHHHFVFSAACLKHEVNWGIPPADVNEGRKSDLAERVAAHPDDEEEELPERGKFSSGSNPDH